MFNVAAATSLGLLLAVVSLAISRPPVLHVGTHSHPAAFHAEGDGLKLAIRSYSADRQTRMRFLRVAEVDAHPGDDTSVRVRPNWFGFGYGYLERLSGPTQPIPLYKDQFILAPWWFLILTSAALPAIGLTRFIRRGRQRARKLSERLCLGCGYDLRATPDRCPECGLPAGAPAAA